MVKDQRERVATGKRQVLMGSIWSYGAELKLIVIALLLLCSLAALLQFIPTRSFPFASSNLRSCLTTTTAAAVTSSPQPQPSDQILPNGAVKRYLHPVGTAAYNFILMSTYRGGPNTFTIMGLSSKPLQDFSCPTYACEYQSQNSDTTTTSNSPNFVPGYRIILPDWGYSRVYTVVIINCTFPSGTVTGSSAGGRLLLHASTNGAFDRDLNLTDTIVALNERPNSWDPSQFLSPPKFDYLYCGSSLFGNLSPQRVREWIAYHVMLFGKKSHFVIHDAGGVHPEVMEVLKPWMELGYVTLEDVREQERFDGFYHNQFLLLNDCLHRYRFITKWMFFFDVDEYIYVPGNFSLASVMDSLKDYTQFTFEQMPMSNQLCLTEDAGKTPKKWGFEKLVYRNVKRVKRRDRKYAVQPRNVFATEVHMTRTFKGKTTSSTEKLMKYFHYHGTVSERREPCRQLLTKTSATVEATPYVLDTTMRSIAPFVRKFELITIGPRLQSTRQ